MDQTMPQSFVSLHCHVVFSTKNRRPWIDDELKPRLLQYIGGILRKGESPLISGGGVADHLHLLISCGKQSAIATIVRDIKANSSGWIHEQFPGKRRFAWQTGYGAFAVSYSNVATVTRYVARQEAHHRKQTFQEEFLSLLRKHHLTFDERYVWD